MKIEIFYSMVNKVAAKVLLTAKYNFCCHPDSGSKKRSRIFETQQLKGIALAKF